MLSASLRYPWHTVSEQEIGNLSVRLGDKPQDVRFREWYEERAKVDTPRKVLNDTGTGLLALAAILAVLRLLTGFPLQDSRSPKWRWLFIVAYLIALAVQVPSSFWYYGLRQSRFEYPTWGDSIIIGVFQTFMACAVFAVVGCLLWWPYLAKSRFPAALFAWPGNQNRFNVIVSLGFGAFTALCLIAVPSEVRDGNPRRNPDGTRTRISVPLRPCRVGHTASRETQRQEFRTTGRTLFGARYAISSRLIRNVRKQRKENKQ